MMTDLRFAFRPLFLVLCACFFSFGFVQAKPIHLVAYGDSGTAGKGVPKNEAYPAQLEGMLRQKGFDVWVTNAGVNGRTSAEAVANLDANVPAGTAVVIVQFGVNDVKHGVAPEAVRKNLDTIVSRLKQRGAGVLVIGHPTIDLSGVASAHGALYITWGGLPDPRYHVPGDPNHHFNAAGLQVMASRMLPDVEKLIARAGRH